MPAVSPVLKWPYVTFSLIFPLIGIGLFVYMVYGWGLHGPAPQPLLVVFATFCPAGAAASLLVLLYKAWAAIQDDHVRMTPQTAVLRCFIPFYNLYWLFQAVAGFARDYNSFAKRHRIGPVRARVALYQFWCECVPLTLIPYAGLLAVLALLVMTPMVMADMCDAINAIADA